MKAILVIDMPNECMECPLRFKDGDTDDWFRFRCHISEDQIQKGERLENCPLRPLPKKIEVDVNKIEDIMHVEYSIEDIYKNKYVADIRLATEKLISLGWNACLKEIEK